MATRARSGADLASTINANTSAPSNTIVVSSSGNITTANDLSLSGHLVGYVSNTYLQATFAQNTAIVGLANDRLQVANAAATYLTKSVALTSNNSLVNLINDREQVANAAVSYVTKAVHLTSNNALINLINDRYQPANLASDLVSYWPSANIINYVASAGGGTTMQTNTSIFIATGGETEVAIPYSNTNHLSVKLNGVRLTPDDDYTAANNTHIGNLLALTAADVLEVTEYKQHTANVLNRSAGGGGGGGSLGDGAQGESYGYAMGGDPTGAGVCNTVDKYSFTSDGNASDVGDLPTATAPYGGGAASATKGYSVGGYDTAATHQIYGFPFASDSSISDVGDTHPSHSFCTTTSVTPSDAFLSGGLNPGFTAQTIISKFPFASEGTSVDSGGDLNGTCTTFGSVTSASYGYVIRDCSPGQGRLEKFPFSISSGTSTLLNTSLNPIPAGYQTISTHQSPTHGYFGQAGGDGAVPNLNALIQKWDFASDTTVTCVGFLTTTSPTCQRTGLGSTSSTASGYSHGGLQANSGSPDTDTNIIDKFPFSSDANASDVGDLTAARRTTSKNVQI